MHIISYTNSLFTTKQILYLKTKQMYKNKQTVSAVFLPLNMLYNLSQKSFVIKRHSKKC